MFLHDEITFDDLKITLNITDIKGKIQCNILKLIHNLLNVFMKHAIQSSGINSIDRAHILES